MWLQLTIIAFMWANCSAWPTPDAGVQYVYLSPPIQSPDQYVYVYPQFYGFGDSAEPWYAQLLAWWQGVTGGGSGEDGGEETDAPVFFGGSAAPSVNSVPNVAETNGATFEKEKNKFAYSTAVLNPPRQFFILPEQQKIFTDPIYDIQPRSAALASASAELVVSKHRASDAQSIHLKSHIEDALNAAKEKPENRVAPVNDAQNRAGVEVDDEGAVVQSLPVLINTAKVQGAVQTGALDFATVSVPAKLEYRITQPNARQHFDQRPLHAWFGARKDELNGKLQKVKRDAASVYHTDVKASVDRDALSPFSSRVGSLSDGPVVIDANVSPDTETELSSNNSFEPNKKPPFPSIVAIQQPSPAFSAAEQKTRAITELTKP